MIKEAYCSFEVAKLLKEKGFNERSVASYNFKGESQEGYGYWNKTPIWYAAPTHQMAMAWLREVHNIFIEISIDEMLKDEGYQWALYYNDTKEIRPYSGWGDSYEQACEAALKYALENLICL